MPERTPKRKASTPRQQLASIHQQTDRDRERQKRQRLGQLREVVSHAQRTRRDMILEAKALCDVAARRLQKIHAKRRAQLERELAVEVEVGVEQCRQATARARGRGEGVRNAAKRQLHSERADQRSEAIWTGKARLGASRPESRSSAARGRAERQRESEETVERDIPHELLPIWRKMRSKLEPSSRMSRTEAFLHWVHDHQGEVYRMLEEAHEASLKRMQRDPNDDGLTEEQRYEAWERTRELEDDPDGDHDADVHAGENEPF